MPTVRLLRDESSAHPVRDGTIAAAWSCYGGKPAKVENVRKLIGPAPECIAAEAAADRADRRDGRCGSTRTSSPPGITRRCSTPASPSCWTMSPGWRSGRSSIRIRSTTRSRCRSAIARSPARRWSSPDLPAPRAGDLRATPSSAACEGYRRLVEILTPDFARDYTPHFPGARPKAPATGGRGALRRRGAEEGAGSRALCAAAGHAEPPLSHGQWADPAALPRAGESTRCAAEVRYIVDRMVEEVLAVDPYFLGAPDAPLDLRLLEPRSDSTRVAWPSHRGGQRCTRFRTKHSSTNSMPRSAAWQQQPSGRVQPECRSDHGRARSHGAGACVH